MKTIKPDYAIHDDRYKLLELGCGAGNYACFFAARGFDVTGIDISPAAIQWAHENAKRAGVSVKFVLDDVVALRGIVDGSIDFVFDGHLMHCIIGEDRGELLRNVRRVLRPHGYFMINHVVGPVKSSPDLTVDPDARIGYLNGETPYRFYPEAEELVDELMAAGFGICHWEYTVTLDDGYGFQHATVQCEMNQDSEL